MRPSFITTIQSETASASAWSWVRRSREPDLALDAAQLAAHLEPQPRIKIAERLVEQEHLRPSGERAGDRDPLLLAAGEPRRRPLGEMRKPHGVERVHGELAALGPAQLWPSSA
jgi:hypothetical protein